MAGVAASCLVGVLVAACGSSTPSVDRFAVSAAGHTACPALIAALPGHVADQARRTSTGSTYAAVWGDPAIELRCGVGSVPGFTSTSPCETTDGVDWFVPPAQIDDSGSDLTMTAVGREPLVEVSVPSHYRPNGPSDAMVDLTKVIKAHTRALHRCQ